MEEMIYAEYEIVDEQPTLEKVMEVATKLLVRLETRLDTDLFHDENVKNLKIGSRKYEGKFSIFVKFSYFKQ